MWCWRIGRSGDSLTPCWLRTSDMASHLILSLFERWSNWDLERLNVSKVIDLVSDTTQIQAHVSLFPLYIEMITLSVIIVLISYIQGTLSLALCFLFLSSQNNSDAGILSSQHGWQSSKGLNNIPKVVDCSPGIGSQPVSPLTMADDRKWGEKRRGLRC